MSYIVKWTFPYIPYSRSSKSVVIKLVGCEGWGGEKATTGSPGSCCCPFCWFPVRVCSSASPPCHTRLHFRTVRGHRMASRPNNAHLSKRQATLSPPSSCASSALPRAFAPSLKIVGPQLVGTPSSSAACRWCSTNLLPDTTASGGVG